MFLGDFEGEGNFLFQRNRDFNSDFGEFDVRFLEDVNLVIFEG